MLKVTCPVRTASSISDVKVKRCCYSLFIGATCVNLLFLAISFTDCALENKTHLEKAWKASEPERYITISVPRRWRWQTTTGRTDEQVEGGNECSDQRRLAATGAEVVEQFVEEDAVCVTDSVDDDVREERRDHDDPTPATVRRHRRIELFPFGVVVVLSVARFRLTRLVGRRHCSCAVTVSPVIGQEPVLVASVGQSETWRSS